MARVNAHTVETQSVDWFRSMVDQKRNALFREITGRDYGIDGIIELFNYGLPTGEFALVQIKGTGDTIQPLKKTPEYVSCKVSSSNAQYAFQKNIPVLLVYISIKKQAKLMYFADLRSVITEEHKKKINKQKEITVKIPYENLISDDMSDMSAVFEMIHSYYYGENISD